MTICNITIELFTEEYYRRGSARVSEGDVWVTLQLLQVSIRYAKTYGVHIQIAVDQQQLCSLHTVTRIQVAFSCSHLKEHPQTLTSAPYCQSWRHCCWWQQGRWDPCHTFSDSADSCSCYLHSSTALLIVMSWHKITQISSLLLLCSSLFNCIPSLSVRLWWWMEKVEPVGQYCCPCSGLYRVVWSPGATCSSKEELPPVSLWTWPEISCWNVRYSDKLAYYSFLFSSLDSMCLRARSQ